MVRKKHFKAGVCSAYLKQGKCQHESDGAERKEIPAPTETTCGTPSASSNRSIDQRGPGENVIGQRNVIGQKRRSGACVVTRSRSPVASRGLALSARYDQSSNTVLADKLYCAANDLQRIATDISLVARMLERRSSS